MVWVGFDGQANFVSAIKSAISAKRGVYLVRASARGHANGLVGSATPNTNLAITSLLPYLLDCLQEIIVRVPRQEGGGHDLIRVKRRYNFYFRDSKTEALMSYANRPMLNLIDGIFFSKVERNP